VNESGPDQSVSISPRSTDRAVRDRLRRLDYRHAVRAQGDDIRNDVIDVFGRNREVHRARIIIVVAHPAIETGARQVRAVCDGHEGRRPCHPRVLPGLDRVAIRTAVPDELQPSPFGCARAQVRGQRINDAAASRGRQVTASEKNDEAESNKFAHGKYRSTLKRMAGPIGHQRSLEGHRMTKSL